MDEIMKKYPNDVKYVLKNGPRGNLDESNTKYTAALYAVAAGQQGKYFEMSHKMFDKSNNTKIKKLFNGFLGIFYLMFYDYKLLYEYCLYRNSF